MSYESGPSGGLRWVPAEERCTRTFVEDGVRFRCQLKTGHALAPSGEPACESGRLARHRSRQVRRLVR